MGASTPFPSPDAIARAERLTRERFVYDGETLEEALAVGSARRRALDAALGEVEAGNKLPSVQWRREFALLLGLERLLSQEEPHLVDGTVLSAHQVDALSGTLTALMTEAQRAAANGNGYAAAATPADVDDLDETDTDDGHPAEPTDAVDRPDPTDDAADDEDEDDEDDPLGPVSDAEDEDDEDEDDAE
ncbi:MAG: hypothetical protein M3022_02135, partial [Actinomycetota bacterium]|nr:hypothetical protein [Actinomycetota bacterium]